MAERWKRDVETWQRAGVIDAATAERIHAFHAQQERTRGTPWAALVALIFGALSLGAGVLLFVAAHWDAMSPGGRFSLVLLMVAALHGGAAAAHRLPMFAGAVHAVGTLSLGAGIYLSAQIFHLHEHWPLGVGLWALGAALAWWLLRHTPQGLLTALLAPAWLVSERMLVVERHGGGADLALAQGLFLLAIVYLFAQAPRLGTDPPQAPLGVVGSWMKQGLSVLGALALFPCVIYLFGAIDDYRGQAAFMPKRSELLELTAHAVAFTLPVALGVWLRRKDAWRLVIAIVWLAVISVFDLRQPHQELATLLWSFIGAAGIALWGVFDRYRYQVILGLLAAIVAQTALLMWASDHEEVWVFGLCALQAAVVVAGGMRFANKDGINTGVVVFGLTVAFFYFSTVMDKLGRSLSLIGLGVLMLLGGFALERARRRLLASLPNAKETP